jgi:hypothetical protein
MKVCRETYQLRMLPFLSAAKAAGLLHLGEKQEAETLLTQSYHAMCLYGMRNTADAIKVSMEEKFGVKI